MTNININDDVVHPLFKYRNHLEFHGYQVEEDENIIWCRHPRKFNLVLKHIEDRGVLVRNFYNLEFNNGRLELLEYINALNADFLFMKAYIDDEDTFTVETFFEGDYDRTNFSILLDNIDYDMRVLWEHELTEKFLG
jgi:hypothetical protein